MRHWSQIALAVAAVAFAAPLPAQTPEDQYVEFFFKLREAEGLERQGDVVAAYNSYGNALVQLEEIARSSPGWKQDVVEFRLRFCRSKLKELEPLAKRQRSNFPESVSGPPPPMFQNLPPPEPLPSEPAKAPSSGTAPAPAPAPLPSAPSAPAMPAPRNEAELAQVRQYAEGLKRELDLTRSEMDLAKAQLDEVRKERADMESRIVELDRMSKEARGSSDPGKMESILAENRVLQEKLRGLENQINERQATGSQMEQAFVEMRAKVEEARKELDSARQEKDGYAVQVAQLQTQLKALQKRSVHLEGATNIDALRQENTLLRSVAQRQMTEHNRRADIGKRLLEAVRQMEVKPAGLEETVSLLADASMTLTPEEQAAVGAPPQQPSPAPSPESKPAPAPDAGPVADARGGARIEMEALPATPSAPPTNVPGIVMAIQGPEPTKDPTSLPMPEPVATVPPVPPVTGEPAQAPSGIGGIPVAAPVEVPSMIAPAQPAEALPQPVIPAPAVPQPPPAVAAAIPVAPADLPQPANVPAQSSPKAAEPAPMAPAVVMPEKAQPATAAAAPQAVPVPTPVQEAVTKPPKKAAEAVSPVAIPPDMQAIVDEAGQLFARGLYDEAAAKYEQVIARYPKNVYALSNLAVVRFQQRKLNEAEIYLKQAIEILPEDDFSHSILGIVYYLDERYDEALAMLQKAEQFNPKDARTQKYLGLTYKAKGLATEAERALARARALDPNL